MNIGTWNVLSWYRPGAALHAVEQLEKNKMDITAIQEVRWPESGSVRVSRSMVYFSGSQQNRHEFGTGFVVADRLVDSLITFEPVSERICYIRFRGTWYNHSFISVYAPTEEHDEDVKDAFYDELEGVIANAPKQDRLVICGDFNAKIGKEAFLKPHVGNYSLHDISNDNGLRLGGLAAANNMMVKSTMFDHKSIHKQTWMSNDGITRNQIDHILINARHGNNIMDVRSLRGIDGDTDHFLVRAKTRERISSTRKGKTTPAIKWDIGKLQEHIHKQAYQDQINNQLGSIEQQGTVEHAWSCIKDAVKSAATATLGTKPKTKRKEWFNGECRRALELRNRSRKIMIQHQTEHNRQQYRDQRAETKRILRREKKKHELEKFQELEQDRLNNRPRKFYQELSNIKKGFQPRGETMIRKEDGNLTTDNNELLREWKQHFDSLLNINNDSGLSPSVYQSAEPLTDDPSYEEVKRAISKLKNNKAPGNDMIPSECLKDGGEILHKRIHRLILLIWENETIPNDWKESIIVPIHKKGDKRMCSNYRGISLISTTYKILANMVLERLKPIAEDNIGDYQCGFRRNRSTVDQIFTIRQSLEKFWEFNRDVHHLFVDFRQAYDSILRVKLWDAMAEIGIPKKLINITKMCINGSRCRIRIGDTLSDVFEVNGGLKQGDAISPILFNIALEKVVRTAGISVELFGRDGPRLLLAFADDIDVAGNSVLTVKDLFTRVETQANQVGLSINEDKTKYMHTSRTGRRDRVGQNVTMGEYNFERVATFKYLGATIAQDNNMIEEIKVRIQSGNKCLYALKSVLASKNISRRTKITIYKTVIRPTVMYASETWTLTKESERKLRVFERRVLRRIFGPLRSPATQQHRIRTNQEILELYKDPDIVQEIKARRLQWAGHVQRQPDSRMVKLAWEGTPIGRRPLGRPRMRWRDNIKADLKTIGIQYDPTLMEDRQQWRKIVQSAKTHPGL